MRSAIGGIESDAVVADVTTTRSSSQLADNRDDVAVVAVLDGVGEQVHEDLLEPRRVADDADGAGGRECRTQLLIPGVGIREHGVDRTLKDAREIEAIAPKLDLAQADARDVHQIVDQLSRAGRPGG